MFRFALEFRITDFGINSPHKESLSADEDFTDRFCASWNHTLLDSTESLYLQSGNELPLRHTDSLS
jgi:hypothetical protein